MPLECFPNFGVQKGSFLVRERASYAVVPRWRITSVSACFGALGTNDIRASLAGFVHMFRMTDHVHIQYAMAVESGHDMLGSNSHGRDEQFGTAINDDINEFIECSSGIINLESGHQLQAGGRYK